MVRTTVGDGIYGRAPGSGIYTRRGAGGGGAAALTYREEVALDTPYWWWPLQETSGAMLDASGNGRTGAVNGSATASHWTRGAASIVPGDTDPSAASIRYAPTNSTAQWLVERALPSATTYTLEAWVKKDETAANQGGAYFWDRGGQTPPEFGTGDGSSTGTIANTFRGSYLANSTFQRIFALAAAVNGETYHLVLRVQPNQQDFYVNGVLQGSRTDTTPSNISSNTFFTLANRFGAPRVYMQHFALYTAFLSADRILAHYEAGIAA